MEKKLLLGVVVVICLCGSPALALDPMGPPTAGLTQGQWSAGLDYAYSETDLDLDGKFKMDLDGGFFGPVKDKLTFKAVEMHKAYLTLGYGIQDNWEVFFRLGGARAETQKPTRAIYAVDEYGDYLDIYEDNPVHDFDTGFAIGFGTKVTLYEDTDLKIGGLFQASWTEMDVRTKYQGVSQTDYYGPDIYSLWSVPSDGELEIWEFQLAVGATYVLSPSFTVYGGPFWHLIDGEYDFKGRGVSVSVYDFGVDGLDLGDFIGNPLGVTGSYDVENKSQFGGYLGAQIDVTDNVVCNAECMLTGDAFGIGTGLTWRF